MIVSPSSPKVIKFAKLTSAAIIPVFCYSKSKFLIPYRLWINGEFLYSLLKL